MLRAGPPTRQAAPVLLGMTVGFVLFCGAGCGGSSSGGGPPPPKQITLTFVAPYNAAYQGNNWVVAGIPSFALIATGTGFTSSSVIQWNGSPLPTVYGDSTDLNATVSSALVAAAGTASITVADASLNLTSNSLPFGIASPAAATAGVVQLITIAPDGTPANDDSIVVSSISTTGRFVAFQSAATNLVPGVASGYREIYERDTCIGAPAGCTPSTTHITVTYDGSPVNGHSFDSSVSQDGRYVAFDSSATNILSGATNCDTPAGNVCAFLRDTCTGVAAGCTPATTPISVMADGTIVGGGGPRITPGGRYVTFGSNVADLAGNAPGGYPVTFLRDTCNGAPAGCTPGTILISESSSGEPANGNSINQGVNSTARYITYGSWASNLGQQNENGWPGIFLSDDCLGASGSCSPSTIKIDNAPDGTVANGESGEDGPPAISAEGRFVAFDSAAMNLVSPNLSPCPGTGSPPESCGYVFLRDTCNGAPSGCSPATALASLDNDGSIPNSGSGHESMSADGRFIAFDSLANNIVPGDTFPMNGWEDIFVRDTCFGAPAGCSPSTVRVSVTNSPSFATESNAINDYPRISGDGHYLVFLSASTNLVPGVTGNGHFMVYLAKTGF